MTKRVTEEQNESPAKMKGADLDNEVLKEIGLEKEKIDETAYESVGQYCILQKLRAADDEENCEILAGGKLIARNK